MYNSYMFYFKKLFYFKLLNCLSCLFGVYVNIFFILIEYRVNIVLYGNYYLK